MSDQNANEPDVVIEADDVYVEETNQGKPKKKRSKLLLIGGLVLLGAIATSCMMGGPESDVTTTVVAPPTLDTTVGGSVQQSSQEYQESLRLANDQNAQAAINEGRTFIPAPEGALRPIEASVESLPQPIVDEVQQAETEPAAVVERRRPVVPQLRRVSETAPVADDNQQAQGQAQQGQQQENPYVQLMSERMGSISNSFVPRQSMTETFQVTQRDAGQNPQGAAGNTQAPAGTAAATDDGFLEPIPPYVGPENTESEMENPARLEEQRQAEAAAAAAASADAAAQQGDQSKVYVAAGDVLYGEVVATVNSDMPLPVIAEVTTGPLKGARMRGTFETDPLSGKMVVSFSQMTRGDVTVPVSAMAIDGFTADTSVRSGIDRRYLRRYGTVFASTFIEGLASGLAEPQKRVLTDANGNNQIVEEQRTTEEAAWNGVNRAVSTINQDLAQTTPKGPKVYLHSGYPVGILFVDDLRQNPNSAE